MKDRSSAYPGESTMRRGLADAPGEGTTVTRSIITSAAAAVVLVALVLFLGPIPVLIGILGITGVIVVLRFPLAGIYALIVLLPFNALVSQVAPGVVGTAYGVMKDAIIGLLLIAALVNRRFNRAPTSIAVLVALLALLPLVSGTFTPSLEQALYGWRNDYEPLLLLVLVPAFVEVRHVRRMLMTIIATAQISAALAVATWTQGIQWLLDIGRLPVPAGQRFPTSLFSSGSLTPRAFSPYVAPNELAAAMIISIAVVWCAPGLRTSRRLLLTLLPAAAVLLTESRSGLFGAAILGAVLLARAMRKSSQILSVGFLLVAGVATVAAATLYIGGALEEETDTSFGGHAASLQEGLAQLLVHPLGMGLGVVGPRSLQFETNYHVESYWLLIALEAGPLILAIFLILLGVLASRATRSRSIVGFLPAAALSGTLVSQIVLPTLQESPVSFLLWISVGLATVVQAQEKADPAFTLGEHSPTFEPRRRKALPALRKPQSV